jgi:DNA-binding GntR family transcriptional regulator
MTTLTRAESVAETLRDAILNGQYLSGERLIEVKIAQMLDVSQNTVRDALRILEGEGWVVKNPRHGVYVRNFNAADAVELCALVAALEPLVLTWALERIDKTTRADLNAMLASARRLSYVGERGQAFDQMVRFHQRIIATAQKPYAAQMLETLYNQVLLLEALREARSPRSARDLDALIAGNETLFRLMDAGDTEAACQHLRDLIIQYGDTVAAALAP